MNLTSESTIKSLLKKHSVSPKKHLGQNFLTNNMTIKKVARAAKLSCNDVVLEIGPGIGTLTKEISTRVKKVIAVEKDENMTKILKETMREFNNIEIVQKDILKFDIAKCKKKYKIVANLPYYLTSVLIKNILESKNPPQTIVLMVQKEIAQRICSKPPKMSLLALSVQFYAKPKIISYVSKKCFWPQPKVDSAIITIEPKIGPPIKQADKDLFFKLAKAGFSQPRKQLANVFAKALSLDKKTVGMWLEKSNISPSQRAETLNIRDWKELAKRYKTI